MTAKQITITYNIDYTLNGTSNKPFSVYMPFSTDEHHAKTGKAFEPTKTDFASWHEAGAFANKYGSNFHVDVVNECEGFIEYDHLLYKRDY